MRNLATLQKVESISPIAKADRLETAHILGWGVVVKKGEFQVGDLCVFFEVDSFLPLDDPRFEFLDNPKTNYDGTKGYRIRSMKLRGTLSQGLALPVSSFPELAESDIEIAAGTDVTELLKVRKYEKFNYEFNMSFFKGGESPCKGGYLPFLPVTDQTRIQTELQWLDELRGKPYYISEKVDGTSCTVKIDETGEFACYSRSNEWNEDEACLYWYPVQNYNLRETLAEVRDIVIRGELAGSKIQKNRLVLPGIKLFVFDVYDIAQKRFFDLTEMTDFCQKYHLDMVKIIEQGESFAYDLATLLELAKGKYEGTKNNREGIVINETSRDIDSISFKVLNNEFLLEEE
jgi:RNA ligase (TIGR02306 family)